MRSAFLRLYRVRDCLSCIFCRVSDIIHRAADGISCIVHGIFNVASDRTAVTCRAVRPLRVHVSLRRNVRFRVGRVGAGIVVGLILLRVLVRRVRCVAAAGGKAEGAQQRDEHCQ